MYNSNSPSQEDLPSTGKLIKSTVIATFVALVLLFTVVMPAEYGIDPTGIGQTLGLTDMGDIKTSLIKEAATDAINHNDDSEAIGVPEVTVPETNNKGHSHGSGNYHRH